MKFPATFILVVCLLVSTAVADGLVDDIYNLYVAGQFAGALEAYRGLPHMSARDGNRLFISALLETDGGSAMEKLKASLNSDLDGKYHEEAHYRIIQLAAARRDSSDVRRRGEDFLRRWEISRYREGLLALLAAFSSNGSSEQKRYLRLLTDEFPGTYFGQMARLMDAETAYREAHYKTATTACRRIINAADDNLAPAGLLLLSQISLKQGDSERALLNYNILRERYPYSIGQEGLLASLRQVSEKTSHEESSEVIEGITYSVQVGVFSDKDNAATMKKRVEGYGYSSTIKKRTISGNTYHVVLAGRFTTVKEAQTAKQKLETGENEVFKVVVNDEK